MAKREGQRPSGLAKLTRAHTLHGEGHDSLRQVCRSVGVVQVAQTVASNARHQQPV